MTARTHDVFAFVSLVTVATFYQPTSLNIPTLFSALVGNIVGGLIPDLDQASNKLWDLLPAGNLVGKVLRWLFLEHRTISHSLAGGYILYRILQWLLPKLMNPNYININVVLVSIMVGFASHLLADSLTKDGIPLFFPLKIKVGIPPISTLRITTGGKIEKYIVLPALGVYLFWFINKYREQFFSLIKLIRG